MNFDHAETTASHATADTGHAWHPLTGLPLGHLHGLAPGTDVVITITGVIEETPDLAVADRIAYAVTTHTGIDHVVLAGEHGYLVASVSPSLDWAAAMRLIPTEYMPRIVSVASSEGILPILLSA